MNKQPGRSSEELGGSAGPAQHERRQAEDALHRAGEDVARSMRNAAESTRAAAADQVEQQKAAASQSLDAFAQAIHRASDELGQRDQTAAARLVHEAANGLENLSRSLSQQDLSQMIDSMREFGRRNPAAFAGGAALAGLALGRLARSSRKHLDNRHGSQGADTARAASAHGSGDGGEFPASRASTMPAPSVSQSGTQPGAAPGRRTGGNPSGGSHG